MSERNYNYIFSKLVNAEDDVVGLLAYAIYKQQKIEYIEDFAKKHDGRGPTDEELAPFNELTSQKKQIENYKNIAETRFGDFLDRLMRRHLEEFKEAQKSAHREALLEAFTSVSKESHKEVVQQLTPSKWMKFGEMALSGIVGNLAFLLAIVSILFLGILFKADYPTRFFNNVLSWLGLS